MIFESIVNRGEFFSNHYLDAVIGGDLGDLRGAWGDAEGRGEPTARSRVNGMASAFFAGRAAATEATSPERRITAMHALNDVVLGALGFPPDRATVVLPKGEVDTVETPLAHVRDTATGRLLVVLEAGMAGDVDNLFDTTESGTTRQLEPLCRQSDKATIAAVPDAISELFATDDPPRYVLVAAGTIVLVAERGKWAEGRFLAVDLDGALERRDTKKAGELETIAALFSADALVPGELTTGEGTSAFETLVDNSHKHAVGVSKELRSSIRQSIETLANEVIAQRLNVNLAVYTGDNAVDPKDLTHQCLRWLYRLLVLLYAESRPELGVVPTNDDAYLAGYSLDRLRELVLVDLDTERARNGSHLHQSLQRLFDLVNDGYHADVAQQSFTFATDDIEEPSREEYVQFPGLDAGLFDATSTPLLDGIRLRNEALQKVLALLMLSPEGKGKKDRGFISYAQLGINQLGAVYEGLMAYTGFFAEQDLYEVAKHGDPKDGTWVLPVTDADDYPDDVFVTQTDPITGKDERVRHERGSFVFRLSGRDRQRSASYYTPEVLTRCVVKHALAELLGLDDYAPENGSSGITEARQILDLTICEPALGSGAFLNEAINQLSAEYLLRRQEELGETLDPEEYRRELQNVKAHFALHQCYGVDLNATAVELAEVSLWLNCMHPGLKAPWFGLQLRRGNSLVGCRRATWRVSQLGDKPWAKTKKGEVIPPVDRPLREPLADDEIHHFLLPGHGWAAAADRKEAKELRPAEAAALREWRKQMLKAPSKTDAKRLQALSAAVEELWERAAERIRLTQLALRRPIDVYGATVADGPPKITRAEAERVLNDPDSALGRLRTLMDLWVGLWFWPFDSGTTPPTWTEWIVAAEEIISVEQRHGPSGQLGFDDLAALIDLERKEPFAKSIAELSDDHAWIAVARDSARREGAWHWALEFGPALRERQGFDLQVGNPPWVAVFWNGIDAVSDAIPALAVVPGTSLDLANIVAKNLFATGLYLTELIRTSALLAFLGSPQLYSRLAGLAANLYLNFIVRAWSLSSRIGIAGLLHQDVHLSDPDGGEIRSEYWRRAARRVHFRNELKLFDDVKNNTSFSMNIYRRPSLEPRCMQLAWIFHPNVVDKSLLHDGSGPEPAMKTSRGDWSLEPHAGRVFTISLKELAAFRDLVGDSGPPEEARVLLPLTRAEGAAIAALGPRETFAAHSYAFDNGCQTATAARDRILEVAQRRSPLANMVLMAGHIRPMELVTQEPHVPFRSTRDWVELELGSEQDVVSNFVLVDAERKSLLCTTTKGSPSCERWRVGWRRRADESGERLLHAALIPPGPIHTDGVQSASFLAGERMTVLATAALASIVTEYVGRLTGKSDMRENVFRGLPFELSGSAVSECVVFRALRLACVRREYASLWEQLYAQNWRRDRWAESGPTRELLDGVTPKWSRSCALLSEESRRRALIEIDALTAVSLDLDLGHLVSIYRAQFGVLQKYESAMAFDASGARIAKASQARGFRQSELQRSAVLGEMPSAWTDVWRLYEQYEDDPWSVDWLGHYTPPFYRPDREKEMTRAYEEFRRRLDAGEYD